MNELPTNDPSPPCSRSEAGFTLVEVLGAFAILSLTLIVLFRSVSGGARDISYVEAKMEMLNIAQSKLASVGHDIPLETGATRGEASHGYQWALDIMPYSQNGRPNNGLVRGYWVEITVTRKTGRRRQDARISLRSLKLKPAR